MNTFRRLMVTVFFAMIALPASVASAETLTFNPAGTLSMTSIGQVRFSAGIISTQCNVTITGSLASPVSTAPGTSIGTFTSGRATPCTVGTVTLNFGTPWTLRIVRMLGTSPSYTGLLTALVGVSYTVAVAGQTCTYGGTIGLLLPIISSTISTLSMLTNSLPRTSGSSLCPSTNTIPTPQSFTLSPAQAVTII